jgi:hypothetical protein
MGLELLELVFIRNLEETGDGVERWSRMQQTQLEILVGTQKTRIQKEKFGLGKQSLVLKDISVIKNKPSILYKDSKKDVLRASQELATTLGFEKRSLGCFAHKNFPERCPPSFSDSDTRMLLQPWSKMAGLPLKLAEISGVHLYDAGFVGMQNARITESWRHSPTILKEGLGNQAMCVRVKIPACSH